MARSYGGRRRNSGGGIIISVIAAVAILIGLYFGVFDGALPSPKEDIGTSTGLDDSLMQVHAIDVGQADSILLRIPSGNGVKNILIDAGTSSGHKATIITDYLNECGVKTLDYFVLTHPHSDHIAGAKTVLSKFDVKNVMIPDCDYSTATWAGILETIAEKDINVIFPEVKQKISVGDAVITVLAPCEKLLGPNEDANNYSIVLKVVYGETSFMFTGDAHTESEAEMLKTFSAAELKCDVLKMGHHGSSTSSSEEFLRAVDPDTVLISVGEGNSYGHPHEETLEKIEKYGYNVFRTDMDGTIVLSSDGKTVSRVKE